MSYTKTVTFIAFRRTYHNQCLSIRPDERHYADALARVCLYSILAPSASKYGQIDSLV
jgi:hypothetical protein